MNEITSKQIILYILKMIRPFYWNIFIMFLGAISWAVNLSFTPYLLKIILNSISDVTGTEVFEHLLGPVSLYIFMMFWITTIQRLYGYFVEFKMIPQLRNKIYKETFNALLSQSHQYYQNNFAGSLTSKINDLRNGIPDMLIVIIDRFFSHSLAFIIATYTLWQVNIRFALAMVVWVIVFAMLAFFVSKKLAYLSSKWAESRASITGKIVDALSNILSIKLFAGKYNEIEWVNYEFQGALNAEQSLQKLYFKIWLLFGYSFVLIQVLNMYLLLKGRAEGWVTIGDFALVLTLSIAVMDFFWQLTHDMSYFARIIGEISQALKTILVIPDIQDSPEAKSLLIEKGEIVFQNVKFHYKDASLLFDNKNLTINAGQKIGLVGYSGSGKTTFVNLILRLFNITSGKILIDKQNIQNVTQESLRESIAVIPQDPSLFHRTLMENIRYAKPDATDEEVIEAAEKADAHNFIIAQKDGYNSMVGEKGIKLSGGQRQRIAIARAILKNAPILILDEATSQLDSITEHQIQKSLWHLMRDKTTIVVAHRLSTLMHMDRILVFDKGVIIEDGSHEELTMKNGLYKAMWEAQVNGFLPEKQGPVF